MAFLRDFFYRKKDGNGIWKWDHYFDIYERHFERFRRTDVRVLEIGVYSGGSLEMWRKYFGQKAKIIGVDLEPDCEVYKDKQTEIVIGDQAQKGFWQEFKTKIKPLDIIIDDGSHKAKHQILTFEELFGECLNWGGVYLCEDVHGYPTNRFCEWIIEKVQPLNEHGGHEKNLENNDRRLTNSKLNLHQRDIKSINFYPYVVVVEKNFGPKTEFVAPKRGTQWQPFKP